MTVSPAPRLRDGIVTALLTPFDDRGEVDWGALDALVDFQLGHGADALFVLGTSGEGLLMSAAERGKLSAHVLERVNGAIPVAVHCGAVETRAAVEVVRDAAASGAGTVAAIPPLFYGYGEASLLDHFRALVTAGPEMDHYIYENPARTGYAMSTALVHRLFTEVGPIQGVKDTGDSVGRITDYLSADPQIAVFTGNNTIVLGALASGARGAVSTTANIVPELFSGLLRAFRGGDLAEARRLQYVAARLQKALTGLPYIAAAKHLMVLRGLPGGRPRAPLPALTDDQARGLESRVRADATIAGWLTPA